MSDLNKAAEAARVLTRQIEAFATVGKALEEIGSLEAAATFAKSEAERQQTTLTELVGKINKARTELQAAQEKTAETEAELEAAVNAAREEVNAAKAEAKAIKSGVQDVADGVLANARTEADKIVSAANAEAKAIADKATEAQAEVDRLNGIIAEARAKLGV